METSSYKESGVIFIGYDLRSEPDPKIRSLELQAGEIYSR
jgi:hypothetical protein